MIAKTFPTLAQRMLHYYCVTMPDLQSTDTVSNESQQALHAFLSAIPETLYNDPSIIGLKATPDAWYGDFMLNKSNPDLIKQMRKVLAKVNKVYLNLINIGQLGSLAGNTLQVLKDDLKFTRRTLKQFHALGLQSQVVDNAIVYWSDAYPAMMPAFHHLAFHIKTQGNRNDMVSAFRRCVWTDDHLPYISSVFDALLTGDGPYARLVTYLTEHGYWQAAGSVHDIRLDFLKNSGNHDLKICSPEAAKHYWGLSVEYDYRRQHPVGIQMRLPKYKEVLLAFDDLSPEMQEIVVTHTKQCDNCRYCVQTDKTGKRPLAVIPVTYKGKRHGFCPLYPVYRYRWTRINAALVDQIITILEAVNALYTSKGVL